MQYARKRDANEKAIILALREAGASVQQLDGSGIPDLLVQFRGVLYLLEVKDERQDQAPGNGKAHRRNPGLMSELTPAQVRWWTAWSEPRPTIVYTPEAALRTIGAL